jgi:hypothetical protein
VKYSQYPNGATITGPSDEYEILGEISLVDKGITVLGLFTNRGIGYSDLLRAAREKYVDADDVVNVSIDKKIDGLYFFILGHEYKMRGIAIKYKNGLRHDFNF